MKWFIFRLTTMAALATTLVVSTLHAEENPTPIRPAGKPAAPVIADGWLMMTTTSTKAGARVCPVGHKMDTSKIINVDVCGKGVPLVTPGQYFDELVQKCPGLIPVSATPVIDASYRYLVLGFKNPSSGSCPTPVGAQQF